MAAQDCDSYYPYDAGAGASVTEDGWRAMSLSWSTDGVIRGVLSNGDVSTASGRNLTIGALSSWVRGAYGANATSKTVAFATNSSGNPRIDTVILRNDVVANKVQLDVLQGTPAGSPVAPSLTQNTSIWEIALYDVLLANGYSTIALSAVTDRRAFAQGRPPGGPLVLACAVVRSANLSYADGVWAAIPFTGAEQYDTAAIHAGSPSSQFQIVAAGLWRFTLSAAWDVSSAGDRGIQIWQNGSVQSTGPLGPAAATGIDTVQAWSYEDVYVAGDYVEWAVSQDSGGALDLIDARATALFLGPVA